MNSNKLISCLILLISLICIVIALPAKPVGKYFQSANEGKYIPNNKGKYMGRTYPYVHNDDKRHLGKYRHIHIPYNGGYGPYSGLTIPYVHDEHGDYSIQTTTTKKPTTTRTTTTTTRRPTKAYNDEGKWKIIRQAESKGQKKYDYSYLTENGIYAEEEAKLKKSEGTHAKGYYEYIGDDDKVYRVHYTVGENGFVPMGEHIPTIPPEIQRALDYVAEQNKNPLKKKYNNGQYFNLNKL